MKNESSLAEVYTRDIAALLASFTDGDLAPKQSLQQMLTSDPKAFYIAAIRVLARGKASDGSRYLSNLISESRHSVAVLLDPDSCSLAEAVAAARSVAESGKKLETALEMALGKAFREQNTVQNSTQVLRILDLLAAVSAQSCWNSLQVELMAYPDKVVRSKAALLIGRRTKNTAWIGRRLMDRDVRVQANAVEALWELDGSESKPLLLAAAKSKNNRVAANAALGLYRLAEKKAVRGLMDMARHPDPSFRISALWAIAETQDPRFLPFLTEQFKTAQGKERLAVAGALSRIRNREKTASGAGQLQMHASDLLVESDGRRRLAFSLSKAGTVELTATKAFEVAVWEAGVLIEDYEVKCHANPALLIDGFVAPRFTSSEDAYGLATLESLRRCLGSKRSGDLWRIDRYALDATPAPGAPTDDVPYDDALASPEVKMRHGCIADREQIEKAISSIAGKDRAAADVATAIQRQAEALGKHAGKRHMFVLLDRRAADLAGEAVVGRMKQSLEQSNIALHGVCVDSADVWTAFAKLCRNSVDGSFHQTSVDELPETLARIYAQQLNRIEVSYAPPAGGPGSVVIKICGSSGSGQIELALSDRRQPVPVPA